MKKLRPILLAGGAGSRLWPLSTEDRPKQFIPIFKEFSLFDLTLQRLNKDKLFKKPLIVTSERYLEQVNESLLRTGVEAERIILEPEAKNTFPAITMAIILALEKDKSENFIVTPSDHYISINKNFHDCCLLARSNLDKDGLTLMGISPQHPSKDFGYISTYPQDTKIKSVQNFIEKPDLEKSKKLIKNPNVFWNAGIFIFNGSWYISNLNEINSQALREISKVVKEGTSESNSFYPNSNLFNKLSKQSFDKVFVEKNKLSFMVELNAGWSDLGSWRALATLQRDPGNSMTLYSEDFYDRTEKPWGYFETLMETNTSKVKLLHVLPGERLSLQRHKHRSETWYVVQGTAKVTKDKERFTMETGDSVIIEKNQLHRLENLEDIPLQIIEVQTGSYFGEDDIARLEDSYGRADLH
jgi:mannose-1-phosphate guanylyltransferase/mannose-6-phosphate isomerase-like protein (cupin superfamily)